MVQMQDAQGAEMGAAKVVATAPPASQPVEIVGGADVIAQVVAKRSGTVGELIERLDSFGFTVGSTRFSIWTALVVTLIVIGVLVAARVGTKLAKRVLARVSGIDPTQRLLSEKLMQIAVWAIAILIGIDLLGIDLTALAVFSGAFGLAIGFGLQKTFGNLIAGIILLMDRSIKPGDVIAVSDMSGRESFGQIRKIGIRAISVITRDKKEYLIPNENLMINQVENWSYSARDVRVKVPVRVAFDTDIALAEALMMQATVEAPRVLNQPETRVLMIGFGESSIDFEIRFWINDPEEGLGGVRSDVLKRVLQLFRENGIRIPYTHRALHLKESPEFQQLISAIAQREESIAQSGPDSTESASKGG